MTGSRKTNLIIYSFFAVTFFFSCNSKQIERNGYLNSSEFKEFLNGQKDPIKKKDEAIELLKLIKEDAFLYKSDLNQYAIFIRSSDLEGNPMEVYTLKISKRDTTYGCKIICNSYTDSSASVVKHSLFQIENPPISSDGKGVEIQTLLKVVSNSVHREFDPTRKTVKYDMPTMVLLYYDGVKYYRMHSIDYGMAGFENIDTGFRNSPLFGKEKKCK